jgi:hypothetical protein
MTGPYCNINLITAYLPVCLALGAFLIPYILFLFLGGVPLFFLELSLGQLCQEGPIKAWQKMCPLLSGTNKLITTLDIRFRKQHLAIYLETIFNTAFYNYSQVYHCKLNSSTYL